MFDVTYIDTDGETKKTTRKNAGILISKLRNDNEKLNFFANSHKSEKTRLENKIVTLNQRLAEQNSVVVATKKPVESPIVKKAVATAIIASSSGSHTDIPSTPYSDSSTITTGYGTYTSGGGGDFSGGGSTSSWSSDSSSSSSSSDSSSSSSSSD